VGELSDVAIVAITDGETRLRNTDYDTLGTYHLESDPNEMYVKWRFEAEDETRD
jgi:hypothetical protein